MSRRIFSRIFSPDFFSSFLWEKVPRKILQENPRENPPKFIQQKSSNTFLQIAQGNKRGMSVLGLSGVVVCLSSTSFVSLSVRHLALAAVLLSTLLCMLCEGRTRNRPPGPHPRIRLPSSGVDLLVPTLCRADLG